MEADLALSQATQVVQGMERVEVLRRIEELLERSPDGLCAFLILDNTAPDIATINIAGNANQRGLVGLLSVALSNMGGLPWEYDDGE